MAEINEPYAALRLLVVNREVDAVSRARVLMGEEVEQLRALLAERDALAADAARYRYLRPHLELRASDADTHIRLQLRFDQILELFILSDATRPDVDRLVDLARRNPLPVLRP